MNGKKGKAVSVVVVAFLLCGVFGGLVVEQSLAVMRVGFSTVGVVQWGGSSNFVYYYNYTIVVPEGYLAHFDDGYIYSNGSDIVNFCCYDLSTQKLVWQGTQVNVNSTVGWYHVDLGGWDLMNGSYCFGVVMGTDSTPYYLVDWTDGNVSNGVTINYELAFNESISYGISAYVDYKLHPIETLNEVQSIDASTVGELGLCAFLIAVSVVLALKSRSWAVNFLFGLSLVGFLGWMFANAVVELWGGWLLFMVLVGAVLVLVKGAVLVRASGV